MRRRAGDAGVAAQTAADLPSTPAEADLSADGHRLGTDTDSSPTVKNSEKGPELTNIRR